MIPSLDRPLADPGMTWLLNRLASYGLLIRRSQVDVSPDFGQRVPDRFAAPGVHELVP